MELLKRLDHCGSGGLIIGGLNWAILALFDTNVVAEISAPALRRTPSTYSWALRRSWSCPA